MQDQRGRRPVTVGNERDLAGDELVEVFALARGHQPPLRPAAELREQLVALTRHSDDAARVELVEADVAVEQRRINFDGRSRPGLVGEAPVEQLGRVPCRRGIDPRRRDLHAVLVEDHAGPVRKERDALIDHAEEERALAFGKHLELGQPVRCTNRWSPSRVTVSTRSGSTFGSAA